MANFPLTAKDFYKRRDDRTDLYVAGARYQGVRVLVSIDEDKLDSGTATTILTTTSNLLSRWCRNVQLLIPNIEGNAQSKIGETILRQMKSADPFGDFVVRSDISQVAIVDFQIHIGVHPEFVCDQNILINASGWRFSLTRSKPIVFDRVLEGNVIGAVAAACFGVAECFKFAVGCGATSNQSDGIFDLYSLSKKDLLLEEHEFPEDVSLGRILMVGAGSVGSAAAYVMKLADVKADLLVVDHDLVKLVNFNRSPIFDRANLGFNKAAAVCEYLKYSQIGANFYAGTWDEFVSEFGSLSNMYDVWLPLANEHNVRWSMQNNFPPLMIHTSTGRNWGVNFGRHIPGQGDCLADRFPVPIGVDDLACSTAPVDVAETTVDAALPFLSLFAGLLIVSDLLKLQLPDYPQTPNFGSIDFKSQLEHTQLLNRKSRPGCICESSLPLQIKLQSETKFSNLFG